MLDGEAQTHSTARQGLGWPGLPGDAVAVVELQCSAVISFDGKISGDGRDYLSRMKVINSCEAQ